MEMKTSSDHCFIEMCSSGGTCLAWVFSEMELDLADEFFKDGETMTWTFARNAMALVKRQFEEHIPTRNFNPRIPYCIACFNMVGAFWKIYEFLMNCFEVFRLRDAAIAALVMGWGFNCMRKYSLYRTMLLRKAMLFPEYMLAEAVYRRLVTTNYMAPDVLDSDAEIVWNVVKTGKEIYLASLLRYGIMYLMPKSDRIPWEEFLGALEYLFSWMNCVRYTTDLERFREHSKPNRRMLNVLRVVQLLALQIDTQGRDDSSPEGSSRKRLCTDPDGNSRSFGLDRFRCLKMVFDAIPEPYVTSQEIRDLFKMVHDRTWSEESEQHADELIFHFEQLHPEGAGPLAPRSLQHLGRCQVRDNLRQSGVLPHGFYNLILPNSLRKYILLEE